MTLATGTTFGRDQIKSLLGVAGMGEVYRAQRFLINNVLDDGSKQPITLVLNWTSGLKQ